MTPPIRTTGNRSPHIIARGYQDRQRVPGPLLPMEQVKRDLPIWQGALLLLVVFVAATLAVAAVSV